MPYDIIIGRDEGDKKKFKKRGLIYLGKGYVKMGNYTSLSNLIWMDVARSHVVLIAGKRGSGKSYTIGVMAEELSDLPAEIKKNIAPLIFDTMGIFWTMKYKNEKEKNLLREWKLKTRHLPIRIFVPHGKVQEYEENQIPVDKSFALKASELETEDWLSTFNLGIIDPVAILIEKTIADLKERTKGYSIEEILDKINSSKEKEDIKKAASALFEAAATWGIFSKKGEKGTTTKELIEAGKTTILDLSCYSSIGAFNIRALVIGLISRKLFTERMDARKKEEILSLQRGSSFQEKKEMPLVWIFLDEAHEFLPAKEKTPATDALIQLLREGRQPGISLVLATQQPGAIHKDVMTQSDIVISHRVTAKPDITALNNIMQTYLLSSINKYLDDLPDLKGSAIILDDNSERIYPIHIRPRFTWHGGEAPVAIKEEEI
jgi:DNA helicase HerA-like ATPase